MVVISTINNSASDGIVVTSDGHAPGGVDGDPLCAAVSTLFTTLWVLVYGESADFVDEMGGYMRVEVPPNLFREWRFVLRGLTLLKTHYPGNLEIIEADNRSQP
jgi:uncharacterized protein YsxB (DUF464 family)